MIFKSAYVSKEPDENGFINYTDDENSVWRDLYNQLMTTTPDIACPEFLEGIEILKFNHEKIPQLKDVTDGLMKATGWQIENVSALIEHKHFFQLLASRKFPAATFIRTREDFKYVKEPDIFHEFFGHSPMLTCKIYADFMQAFAVKTLELFETNEKLMGLMQRLYWFTVEFGLIQTKHGLKNYGGGSLSSPEESVSAVKRNAHEAEHLPFNVVEILRTPYRIDIMQPKYFVLESFEQLYHCLENIEEDLQKACYLGEREPTFFIDDLDDQNLHIFAC